MPQGRICPVTGGMLCLACDRDCRLRRNHRRRDHGTSTAHWSMVRVQCLALAGWRCQLRLPGCTKEATTVHLRPELGGDHRSATSDDVTACCAHCHGVVDAPRASQPS